MEKQVITSDLFDLDKENPDFKCDICSRYLSIAPILHNETVGKVCGRCVEQGETERYTGITFLRQKVYEDIAKHITFPCSYQLKGCKEVLTWDAVSQHEETCAVRKDKCIFGYEEPYLNRKVCDWIGNSKQLFLHLKEAHTDQFQQFPSLGTTVENFMSGEYIDFDTIIWTQFKDLLFVCALFWDKTGKKVFAHVLVDASSINFKDFTFDLEVSDTQNKKKMNFPGIETTSLCNKAFTSTFLQTGFSINSKLLYSFFKTKVLKFSFNIKKNGSDLFEEKSEPILNENFIFKSICTKCEKILYPPIYTCSKHHNICEDCCRSGKCKCEAQISKHRNDILENLSRIAIYNCTNKDIGCSKLLNFKSYYGHSLNCDLTTKSCVMSIRCDWSGNNFQMLDHIRKEHSPINLKEENLFTYCSQKSVFCTIFEGKIFVLKMHYQIENSLSIGVQYLSAEKGNFQFKLTIRSQNLKLECTNFCTPIFNGKWCEYPITIIYPYNFLTQFLIDRNQFFFELDIFRANNSSVLL